MKHTQKGLTLIELMIVLAILTTIVMSVYRHYYPDSYYDTETYSKGCK